MSEVSYHLGELEIARNPADPRHILPTLPDHCGSLLDLGCGIGQTLMSCGLTRNTFTCGVDIDAESLAFGKQMSSPHLHFVRARGELLPFADGSFEAVISRVALPFMQMPRALQEIARILKPGGHVWLTLHPFGMLRGQWLRSVSSRDLKSSVFQTYVLINGACFHLTGRQFSFPFGKRRCESFQTVGGMTRAMRRAGFELVRAHHERFFVVTAVKGSR